MSVNEIVASVNDKNFQKEVIESPLPVVVSFEKNCWGTTHIMKPILKKIASEYVEKIKVFKYDLEANSITSGYYGIENRTTILIFNKGSIVSGTGVISKEELKKIIENLFNNQVNE